jgi:hypothetical protein
VIELRPCQVYVIACPAWRAERVPTEPSPEVLVWVRTGNIAHAKAKENERAS